MTQKGDHMDEEDEEEAAEEEEEDGEGQRAAQKYFTP
jgi:hypothetical protein